MPAGRAREILLYFDGSISYTLLSLFSNRKVNGGARCNSPKYVHESRERLVQAFSTTWPSVIGFTLKLTLCLITQPRRGNFIIGETTSVTVLFERSDLGDSRRLGFAAEYARRADATLWNLTCRVPTSAIRLVGPTATVKTGSETRASEDGRAGGVHARTHVCPPRTHRES